MSFNIFKDGLVAFTGLTSSGQGPIVGVTNAKVATGIKPVKERAAGQVTNSFVGIMEAAPKADVTCYDMGTLIANGVSTAPLAFGSGQTCTGVTVYGVQAQEDGTVVTNLSGAQVGVSYTYAQGLVTFNSCNGRQGNPATASMTIYGESVDGVTDPVTVNPTAVLPEIPTLSQLYTLGQFELNGATIPSTESLNYNANFKVERKGAAGTVFPTKTYVSEYNPELTVGCYDATTYGTYSGSIGAPLGSSSFVGYLQAIQPQGTRVPAGTASHIKIAGSASQGMVWVEEASLQPDTSSAQIHICPVVGGSPVLTMSVAQIT
jgi:hypothetical protein